jgi:hypothetical protein
VRARWANGRLAQNVSFALRCAEVHKSVADESERRGDGAYRIPGLFPGEPSSRGGSVVASRACTCRTRRCSRSCWRTRPSS